ncbi:MAG: hypothetical protein IID44_12580 [Planctomycetes bacterium]|nr:hypothetical protein [Planctomycetota bacterium]
MIRIASRSWAASCSQRFRSTFSPARWLLLSAAHLRGVDQGILGQSKDAQDAGFNVFVPTLGERDLRLFLLAGHLFIQRIDSL